MSNSNICWFAADFTGVMLVQRTEAFPSLLGNFHANSAVQKLLSCFVNKHAWQPSLQSMERARARLFKQYISNKGLKTALHGRDLVKICQTLQTGW